MALAYTFPTPTIFKLETQSTAQLTAAEKALAKASTPELAKKFVAEFKKVPQQTLREFKTSALEYMQKHMIGSKLIPMKDKKDLSIPEAVLVKLIVGPQRAVLIAKLDLSVHVKNNNAELHATDCKGAMKVLLTVKP